MNMEMRIDNITRQSPEKKAERIGDKFKAITIFGTFSGLGEEMKEEFVQMGRDLAKEGVGKILGGDLGYPGAAVEGFVEEGGHALVMKFPEREKQKMAEGRPIIEEIEKEPLQKMFMPVENWEGQKTFLFNKDVDAYIFLHPSKTLGTIVEAFEAIDRMTYWSTIDNPKKFPTIFVGEKWEEKNISFPGVAEKISLRQMIEGLISHEQESFKNNPDEKYRSLDKQKNLRFVKTPEEALEVLRKWEK